MQKGSVEVYVSRPDGHDERSRKMNSRQELQLIIAAILVMSFLVGCGNTVPTFVAEAPPPASTPEPRAATPTPKPPTATPTLGLANPQADATLTGEIEVSKIADSGTINLKVSEDGTSLTQVDVTMINPSYKCSSGSMESSTKSGSMTLYFYGPFPITEGKIDASLSGGGRLKGQFRSPVEASGTATIIDIQTTLGITMTCDLGTFNWSAKGE
jgi:hypothetical protein